MSDAKDAAPTTKPSSGVGFGETFGGIEGSVLPLGVTRAEQDAVNEQAGKITVEGASLILTPELAELKALGPAAKELPALRKAYVDAVGELKSAADSLKVAGADTEAIA
jgi:hypothetical protein